MTLAEFEEKMGSIECLYCASVDLQTRENAQHIELYCSRCGKYQCFLGKRSQPEKRPKLKTGTVDEVWNGSGGHCAHCGLNDETLELLGLQRTVQHVPPFAVNGHEGYLIPLCSWCQQHSATAMKQLTALVERLAKKFDVRNAK